MGSGGWEGSRRNHSICKLVAFCARFPPVQLQKRQDSEVPGQRREEYTKGSLLTPRILSLLLHVSGLRHRVGFSNVPLENGSWVPGFLGLLRKIPASAARGKQLPLKQTTMGSWYR